MAEYAPAQFLDFHTELFTLWDAAVQEAVDAAPSAVQEPTVADIQETAPPSGCRRTSSSASPTASSPTGGRDHPPVRRDGFQGTPTVLVDGEEFLGWPEAGALADEVRGTAD